MKLKKITLILIVILAVLTLIAGAVTFTSNNSIIETPKGNASVVVTGDVMFARNMAGVLSLDESPFRHVENVTGSADLLLINFENAATTSGYAVKGDVPLKCDPSYVPLAKANNNTVAALANNHLFDYGTDGMKDTLKSLDDAGITHIGAGNNESQARQTASSDINGRNITIINYMDSNNFKEYSTDVMPQANGSDPGYSAYDSDVAKHQIQDAKANGSDVVIVYFHFGNEYSRSPNPDQEKMAHEVIDYGADAVLGSHPHVTQGIEMYKGKPIFYSLQRNLKKTLSMLHNKGKPIFYSLGNFIFDMSNSATHIAYIVKMDFVNDTGECTVYPVIISGYLPYFMGPDEGTSLLNSLSPQCDDLEITPEGTGKLYFNLTGDTNGS